MSKEYFIGLMSGTSMDAIDAVLVTFNPLSIIATHSEPLDSALKKQLIELCSPGDNAIQRMGEADVTLGHLFAKSSLALIKKAQVNPAEVAAIGSHGQTIRHAPNDKTPFTLQIGDPNIVAAMTGITTVADFRRRDMALGGQAAPLAPAFHHFLLQSDRENRWVLNIGGIANVTYLPPHPNETVIGFDTGPGNTLLDAWSEKHLNKRYDDQGKWAAAGSVNQPLLSALLADDYFKRSPPKSTGREYFNLNWLTTHSIASDLTPENIQATLTALTSTSIANAIHGFRKKQGSVWLCGGGAHNQALVQQLQAQCAPLRVTTTTEVGIDPDWVEAVCFAWLAKQTLSGKPGNLPSVTGAAKKSILGAVYYADAKALQRKI